MLFIRALDLFIWLFLFDLVEVDFRLELAVMVVWLDAVVLLELGLS